MRILTRLIQWAGLLIGTLFLMMIGLFIATAGDHAVPDTVVTDPTLPRVEIDGVLFHAETFGNPQNPVVVVVHGGPGNAGHNMISENPTATLAAIRSYFTSKARKEALP